MTLNKLELRFNKLDVKVDEENGVLLVEGYANETGKPSHKLGKNRKFYEVIKKGAFKKSLQVYKDVLFLLEHDTSKILSSTKNGSLTINEDERGLKIRAEIIPTSFGRDTYELIKSGIFKGMSFGFVALNEKWEKVNGENYRTINELIVKEVSVVREPAYPDSIIEARSKDVIISDDVVPKEIVEKEDKILEEKLQEILEGLKVINSNQEFLVEAIEKLKTTKDESGEQEPEIREEDKKEDEKESSTETETETETNVEAEETSNEEKEVKEEKEKQKQEIRSIEQKLKMLELL